VARLKVRCATSLPFRYSFTKSARCCLWTIGSRRSMAPLTWSGTWDDFVAEMVGPNDAKKHCSVTGIIVSCLTSQSDAKLLQDTGSILAHS